MLTADGYVRLKRWPHRDKYEHRVVSEQVAPLAPGFDGKAHFRWEVHHIDFRRDHNCLPNLLRLDERLHRWHWGKKGKRASSPTRSAIDLLVHYVSSENGGLHERYPATGVGLSANQARPQL